MLDILFESENFLAIQKPPNVSFHSEDRAEGFHEGIVSTVKAQFDISSLFPVHRLDHVTSGVLLFAKNKSALSRLSSAFEQGAVQKHYLAISDRRPSKKQGSLIGDMKKTRGGSYKLTRDRASPAITEFKARKVGDTWAFLLRPKTGKTHQLRVACKALGSPILGDERYGGTSAERTYLHALRLEFSDMGDTYTIHAKCRDGLLHDAEEFFRQGQHFN